MRQFLTQTFVQLSGNVDLTVTRLSAEEQRDVNNVASYFCDFVPRVHGLDLPALARRRQRVFVANLERGE